MTSLRSKLSRREAFDLALAGLASQGFQRSFRSPLTAEPGQPRGCLYRGPHGLKCAIGHLIPDEAYCEGFDGIGEARTTFRAVLTAAGLRPAALEFARALQLCHDEGTTPSLMKDFLRGFAARQGFELTPEQEALLSHTTQQAQPEGKP